MYSKSDLDQMSHREVLALYRQMDLGSGEVLVKCGPRQGHKRIVAPKAHLIGFILDSQKN